MRTTCVLAPEEVSDKNLDRPNYLNLSNIPPLLETGAVVPLGSFYSSLELPYLPVVPDRDALPVYLTNLELPSHRLTVLDPPG